MEGNGCYPEWIENIRDETLRKNVATIFTAIGQVRFPQVRYQLTRGKADEAKLESAEQDFRDKLLGIYSSGTPEKNPLWDAIMMVRPQVIGGNLDTIYTQAIAEALWTIKDSSCGDKEEYTADAAFFGRLASRLNGKYITFYRATISGDLLAERKNGKTIMHYFPGIPLSIRWEAGVRLSTRPDNLEAVKKAYQIMAERADGAGREAMEAHLRDIEYLAKLLFYKEIKKAV